MPSRQEPDPKFLATASRRRLLTATGTGAIASLAGCSSALTRTLRQSEVDEEGDETHLHFEVDGERVATVSLLHRWDERERDDPLVPLGTNVWHDDGTRLESLRYAFRPTTYEHPPELYLQRPGGYPWEPIEFSRAEDGEATVLEVPDLGFQGRGSVALDLLVEVYGDAPVDLRVDVAATLGPDGWIGRTYDLEGTVDLTIPGSGTSE